MPELPEVEVVKRSLERNILNLIIKKVKINDANLRYKVNKTGLSKLIGKKITKIKRRSKFLILEIGKTYRMLVHLGMTGKFFIIDNKDKKFKTSFYYFLNYKKDQKHDRVIFILNKKHKLIYNDVRKFGFIKIYSSSLITKSKHLTHLGPEPLEKNWNFFYLKKYVNGRERSIKNILMDQKCVSGLGNIYVNEILFLSGIRPVRQATKLKNFEIEKIIKYSKKILKNSIKLGGSTIKDFSSENGKKGVFQQHFKVYGRENQECSNVDCNLRIIRTVISNRATFFCKKCQK
jgi:formamidopyrimidine-DNA glycosylase